MNDHIYVVTCTEGNYDCTTSIVKAFHKQSAADQEVIRLEARIAHFNSMIPRLQPRIEALRNQLAGMAPAYPGTASPSRPLGVKKRDMTLEAEREFQQKVRAHQQETQRLDAIWRAEAQKHEIYERERFAELWVELGLTPEEIEMTGASPHHLHKKIEIYYDVVITEIE